MKDLNILIRNCYFRNNVDNWNNTPKNYEMRFNKIDIKECIVIKTSLRGAKIVHYEKEYCIIDSANNIMLTFK